MGNSRKKLATLRFEREEVDFADLNSPQSVRRLEIAFCNLKTPDGIECLTKLEDLHIHYARELNDLSAIELLKNLRRINLYSLPRVQILFDPAKLKQLAHLSYNNVSNLPTLHGIEKLKYLTDLGLSRVKVLDGDYQPIINCQSLERVFWHGGPFPSPALREIRQARPDLLIGGNSVINRED